MIKKRSCVIDIESNGLLEDLLDFSSFPYKFSSKAKLWCIVVIDLDTGEEWSAELEDVTKEWMEETLKPFYYIIAHNGIKFDLLQLLLFGVLEYKVGYLDEPDTVFGRECRWLDSLILSRLANPDRGGHSLAMWGKRVGELKDDYRQQCIEAGYIDKDAPDGAEFKEYNPLMLPYCRQDCKTNAKAFKAIMKEFTDHDWGDSIRLEHKLADLSVRRESLGFKFDKELADKCLKELNAKLQELADKVEPLIPPKPLNQTELNYWTPPKTQLKKNGDLGNYMINFLSRIGATCKDDGFVFEDNFYPIPYAKPLKESVRAEMKDFDHIKMHLISLGWDPIEWSERDMTKDSKKKNLSFEKRQAVLDRWWRDTMNGKYTKHRLEGTEIKGGDQKIYDKLQDKLQEKWPVRVYTSPKIRVGIEKDLCPNLLKLGEKVAFAKDFADWLTYRHRRNAISGGVLNEDTGTPSSGFLSAYREVDGRVPTPSIEIGASCVVADTKLITFNGLKNIVDVIIGDEVLTHTGTYKKVIDVIDNGIKGTYKIRLHNGMELVCTDNHPFLTQDGWKRLSKLSINEDKIYCYGINEYWDIHPKFPNYKVSTRGKIVNKKGRELKHLTPKIAGNSRAADLYNREGNKTRINVGKLVCETFYGKCPKNLETRHLDGNASNNNLQNLQFGTSKQNSEDAKKHRQMLKKRFGAKDIISDEQVLEIREYFNKNKYKRGDDEILGKKYGVSRKYMSEIRRGVRRKIVEPYKQKYHLVKIKSIEFEKVQPTYDITVKDDHSYVANSIVTHNTNRYTHKIVANIPRASSTYGKEMRSLFRAGDGAIFFGFDYSSLENRIQGSYIYKYPGGPEMAESLVADKPFDSHTKNAEMLGITRSDAKSFTYACLSEDTEVLTTDGFVNITKLDKGDEIITYNTKKDLLENDVVLNTINFSNKEMLELKSSSFKIKATADHRWYGKQRHSPKNKEKYYSHKFFTTEEVNTEKSILNAAWYKKDTCDIGITKYEAKLLGYIASDGYLKWSSINLNKKHKARGIDLRITQSENTFLDDIEETLKKCNLNYNSYLKTESSNCVFDFVIVQGEARRFLDKVFKIRQNKHDIDWVKFILSLSSENRKAFYTGFFNGDGHKDKNRWERITQNYGSIYDAITLCCFLSGRYVSHQKKTDTCGVIAKQTKRFTTGQKMTKTNLGIQPSYCITTNNSTFVIRQGNTITITGNCLYGAAAPKIAKMLNTDKKAAKGYIDDFWNGNPALNSLKKNLEKYWESKDKKFVLGIDGRKIRTRSKHSLLNALFQSGGVIFAKYVSVYLMQMMEQKGLCIDPFIGKPDICSMIEYHDEQDMYANPKLFKFQVFNSEEEAKEFVKNWTGGQLSAISEGKNGKYFVSLPGVVSEGIEESMKIVREKLKISVDMGFEYMLGNNWYECH